MHAHSRERGAALILLIGITATLAILAASLVTVLANQQHATAMERSRKTSQQYAEGGLDTALTLAKSREISQVDGAWLDPTELHQAFTDGFDGGVLPDGMTAEFFVYDNSGTRDQYGYDANADRMMWIEVLLTWRGKSSRMRVLLRRRREELVTAFPKAVVYSDTGIRLLDTSDVYAVKSDGVTPWAPAPPWATTIMAGGGWRTGMPSGAKNFEANNTANLASPSSSVQSVNVQANGAVSPTGKFNGTIIGGVGLLSDYFDQAAQADLGDEAQAGETHAAAPAAPAAPSTPVAPTPTPAATFSTTERNDFTNTATTTPFTMTAGRKTGSSTNINITRTVPRTYNLRDLYVRGNLTLSGPLTVNVTGFLRVDGTLTISNTGAAVTHTISGPVYAASTSASSLGGNVTFNAASLYTGGALTIGNTSTVVSQIHSAGALTLSGTGSVSAGTSIASAGAITISNAATTTATLRAGGNLSLTGNTTVTATSSAYAGGSLAVSGSTSSRTDQFGSVYVAGTGNSSVAGVVAFNSTNSIYCAGPLTMSNAATTTGLFYAAEDLSLTGNTAVNSTALVVLGGTDHSDTDLTISGATSPMVNQLGAVWVKGTSNWSGTSSVRSTYYTNALAPPAPMYLGILSRSGTYSDVYGPTWCVGNAGTSNVAVRFSGPTSGSACTVMCRLLATTEKTVITGKVNFGTLTQPMVYYMMCDNDTLYSNTMLLGDSGNNQPYLGTFNGLMVIMEACMEIYSNVNTPPCVIGAVFNGTTYRSGTSPSEYDITLRGAASVAYNQAVLDAVTNTSITTTTWITQIVPGSWQQLPAN